jgi:DNA-binding NarL/FixJ family response regulator
VPEDRPRLLFVDDEDSLRHTIPAILKAEGFEVVAAASAAEALQLIATQSFDVLLSDLNIGELSDGFTVVSAMKRSQPNCRTLILTGFPDFDNALENIRQQADGYILKPTKPKALAETIRKRLATAPANHPGSNERLAQLIENDKRLLVQRWLESVRSDEELQKIVMTDQERIDHVPAVLDEVIDSLKNDRPLVQNQRHLRPGALHAAKVHGESRRLQGYTLSLTFREARILQCQIFELTQENLLELDMSNVIPDLTVITDTIEVLVAESIKAFIDLEVPAPDGSRDQKRTPVSIL